MTTEQPNPAIFFRNPRNPERPRRPSSYVARCSGSRYDTMMHRRRFCPTLGRCPKCAPEFRLSTARQRFSHPTQLSTRTLYLPAELHTCPAARIPFSGFCSRRRGLRLHSERVTLRRWQWRRREWSCSEKIIRGNGCSLFVDGVPNVIYWYLEKSRAAK